MRYPDGACQDCGERLYGTADGGTFCPNCGEYFEPPAKEAPRDESEASDAVAEAS